MRSQKVGCRSSDTGRLLTWPEPFFFLKPTSSFISPGEGPVEIPKGVVMHHEGELWR
jgi:2-keto-4-pentenoate hydratase/2-oxohepta-3-ene-1,7-dioic acid hydratase in catechol pathway